MSAFKKLLFLFLTAAAGLFGFLLATVVIFQLGVFSETISLSEDKRFQIYYFGGGMWALILGCLIGVCYIFSESTRQKWYLWAPLYIPMLYLVGAVTYYSV
jgi:p-aminobenzoyl-glutamate transporter AbgT